MKKFFTLFAMLCLAVVSATAAMTYAVDKQLTWDDVKDGSKSFVMLRADNNQVLYCSGSQNLAMAELNDAIAGGETPFFRVEALPEGSSSLAGNVLLRGYKSDGTAYSFWGGTPAYINAQPLASGWCTFVMGLNNQLGQDQANGAVWKVEYVEGQGFTVLNYANERYLSGSGATNSADPIYWNFVTIKEAGEEKDPDPVYVWPSNAVDLTADMFKTWSSPNADATVTGTPGCAYDINKNTGQPYGDGNVGYLNYADLTSYDQLIILVKKGAAQPPRPMFNRLTDGGVLIEFPRDEETHAGVSSSETCTDGHIVYTYNLAKLAETEGFVHLNAIKIANWGQATVLGMKVVPPAPNTIAADIYDVKATVTLAEGVTESMIPEEFKKYVGEYTTRATLAGDEKSLVITENREEGLFEGFEVKGDAVKVSADKTITLNEKVFTIRTADDEVAGKLAITPMVGSETPSYGMDNATIYYKDKKIATVSNIFMTVAPEEVIVKVTYVDADQADVCLYDATATQWRAGYNAITEGKVTFPRTDWKENKITYVGVDGSTMKGFVKNATLTAEVSGSSDSKRGTTWGVGYNNSTWSEDMTYNTADKSITTVGALQTQDNKSATNFKQVSFDVTDAFKDGKVKNLIIYETAAAGGYIKNIKVEFKMAATELDAVKEQALEKANALPSDGGLFSYSQTDIDNYKAAVEAATTVEEVEAIALPEMNKPSATQDYQLANVTATGTFLGEAKLVADNAEGIVRFEETEGGYYIKVNGKYLNMKGGDTWSMSATETPTTVWKINRVAEGEYTIQGPNGLIGSDNVDAGSATYGNKPIEKNGKWTIEVNTPVNFVQATENAAQKIVKFFKNNMLIIVNEKGEKYNAAGQIVK